MPCLSLSMLLHNYDFYYFLFPFDAMDSFITSTAGTISLSDINTPKIWLEKSCCYYRISKCAPMNLDRGIGNSTLKFYLWFPYVPRPNLTVVDK